MTGIHAYPASKLASRLLPGRSAIVRIADEPDLLPPIKDTENVVSVLDCVFMDQDGGERSPTAEDAGRILAFCRKALANPEVEHIVAQCQAGVGRSVAVCAAIAKITGQHWEQWVAYNRTLYRLLLAEAGIAPEPEPLVSIAVRVKYDAAYLMAFYLSLQRQRYDNWEMVAYTDGDRPDVRALCETMTDGRTTLVVNTPARGRWGHPYRQGALALCKGEWIGTNNDDNYLTPGYIEQLVRAGEQSGAKLVLCNGVHRYSGWGICPAGSDLCCWLARRELVEQVTWDDYGFLGDQAYLQKLMQAAGGKVAEVPRPLVVKN